MEVGGDGLARTHRFGDFVLSAKVFGRIFVPRSAEFLFYDTVGVRYSTGYGMYVIRWRGYCTNP